MTTNEMRADVKELLKRVDEDAKGTRCLTMAEVTLCLDELRRLATPSVAPPQAKCTCGDRYNSNQLDTSCSIQNKA
jgi:hypothetical protein